MIILYHSNCFDGFCAAWLASKVYPDASFMAVQYGISTVEMGYVKGFKEGKLELQSVIDHDVMMLDFSFKRDALLKLKDYARSLIVLDHHKSAQEDLADLDFCVFDMEKSGARLTQEFFDFDDHWLIGYTEDRDLWRWKLPQSKEINASLRTYPMDFSVWDTLEPGTLAIEGAGILRYQEKIIQKYVKAAREVNLDGYDVLSVCTHHVDLTSEIGEALAKDKPFSLTWFEMEGVKKYSLRSIGDFDVSVIAKAHGGGGHRNAAGFEEKL